MTNYQPIKVYRGDYVESVHQIHIAVVNSEGNIIYSFGKPNEEIYARSSLKPFQALSLFDSKAFEKYNLTKSNIAVACASHSAEKIHREEVNEILEKINLKADDLSCGYHPPRNPDVFKEVIEENITGNNIVHNCSGKHAGILASCYASNLNIQDYYEKNHYIQIRIKEMLAEITEVKSENITEGVDGCNLLTFRLPLHHLAIGYSKLGTPANTSQEYKRALSIIRDSMMSHPELVAGTNRFDTDLMKAANGTIVSKMGAEGIQCIGLVDQGIGIAIKVEDGNERAASVAAIETLKELGYGNEQFYEELSQYYKPILWNASGNKVGHITSDFQLKKY